MKDKLKTAAGCLLFASIFGAVGVFASWVIFGTLYAGYMAQDWVLVKADVLSTHNGVVSYRYKLGDREFTNDRMGTFVMRSSESDNGLYERAVEAKSANKPITVFVNPDDPAQSMIDRGIDWQPLVFFIPFMLGFGGVGLGALWMMFRTFVPARPRSGTGNGLGAAWFFTIMWNSIAMPIAFLFVPRMIEEKEWVGLFVLIFPLIGVLLLWGALYTTWKAFLGLFKGSKMPPYKGRPHVDGKPFGGLDPNKKAKDLTPEEMDVVRGLVKKKPKMVESNPEVLRAMEQDNGLRGPLVGMVSAALPDGASRRLAQADAEESQAARVKGDPAP